MAQKSIEIPVNLKLELQQKSQDLKRVVNNIQEQFGEIDVGSALYKNAAKSFSKIGSKLNLAEALLGKDFFTQGDFNKVISNLSSISDILSEITTQAANTQSYRILGLDTTELDASKESLKELKTEILSLKNLKVGDIKGVGALTSQQLGKLNASSKKTGFSVNKSYSQNIDTMTNKLNEAHAALVTLEDQAAQTEKQLAKINAPALTIMKGLKNVDYNNQAEGFSSILDSQLTKNGRWKSGGKSVAQGIAQLIPDAAEKVDFNQPAAAIVQQLKDAITDYVSQNKQNSLWEVTKIAKNGTNEQKQALQDQLLDSEKLEEAKKLQDQNSETQKKITALSSEITAHNELIDVLKKSRTAYEDNIDKQKSSSVTEAENRVRNATAKLETEKSERQKNFIESGKESNNVQKGIYGVKTEQDDNISLDREADRRAQEAESFKENLKQSVRHWMSAQQIINIVKDGIRQAVQDIKGLDSAMSNIAVVTDMSISDLWGKINDYMAIAQQYGVTTQGVYEVSQLYYQQGLATAEVMELTTETLKLARVANMDYKDSADAMTVALRGFKMEMSEAATVTDVYSKVAAITASDQAELAVAMSKTASSAASVGSSFENTTAMLAVMVETTRESAQNLGSALKSIISRYGEMKSGLTQDSEGEIIDYNKVDTALRSIGISIKDAQGQFRDFDDVIFELSEAWGGLDKNTQRYIATIMAGNRQQSRFIALVDNYERLKEVSDAAAESEDAGLLQYAKTLDSLETKLNNIKTSFQQFYMNIVNGPVIGTALDLINKLIEGFNRLGSLSGIFSLLGIIKGLKSILTLAVSAFSNSYGQIISDWRATQKKWFEEAKIGAYKRGQAQAKYERKGYQDEQQGISELPGNNIPSSDSEGKLSWLKDKNSKKYQGLTVGLSVGGGVASGLGAVASSNGKLGWAAGLNTAGSAMTGASIGAALGPYGMLAGAIIGGFGGALVNYIGLAEKKAQALIDEAKEKAEEANIERAKSADEYKTLSQYAKKFEEVSAARNDSNEAYEEWISLNNEIAEKYPELISYIDAEGNSIVNLSDSYEGLAQAKQKALEDNQKYWKAQLEYYEKLINYDRSKEISTHNKQGNLVESVFDEGGNKHALTILSGQVTGKRRDVTGQDIIDSSENYLANLYTAEQSGKISKGTYDRVNELISKRIEQIAPEQVYTDEEVSAKFALEDGEKDFIGQAITKGVLTYDDLLNANTDLNPFYNLNAQYGELLKIWNEETQDFDLSKIEGQTQKNLADSAMAFYYAYQDLFTTDENGQLLMDESAQAIATIQKNQKAWEAAKESYLSSEIALIYSYTDAYESMSDLEGEEALFLAMEKNKARIAGQDFDIYANTLNSDKFMGEEGTGSKVQQFYEGLSTIQQDAFQALLNNLDSFSLPELEKELKDLGASDEIISGFKSMYGEQFSGTYRRIAENLLPDLPDLELLSFEDWKKQKGNKNKTEAEYLERYLRPALAQSSYLTEELAIILATSSIEELEAYNKFYEENERLIENSSGQQKKVAQARAEKFKAAFSGFINEDTVFGINMKELDEAQQTALWELLNADDKGTYDWKYRLEAFAEETGQKLDNINDLVYENINTRIERIFDSADETVKELEDFTKKQEDGFELQEARAFASKIGKRVDEVFEFKDGKLIISNYNKYIEDYYKTSIQEIDDLNSDYTEFLQDYANINYQPTKRMDLRASLRDSKGPYVKIMQGIDANDLSVDIIDALVLAEELGNVELFDQILKWGVENVEATEEDIEAMLQELYAANKISKEQLDDAFKSSTSNTAFNDFIKTTENAFDNLTISYQNFKENFQLLSPGNEIPDTAEEWADWFNKSLGFIDFRTGLITDFDAAKAFAEGLEDEDATKWMTDLIEAQIGSSFDKLRMGETLYTDVDKTAAKEALQTLGVKTQELLDDLLEDNIISAEESLLLIFANNQEGETLVQTAERIGADFNEIIENMVGLPGQIVAALGGTSALTPEMRDAMNEVRNTLYDSITGLLGGTGTWDQATKLQAAVGTNVNLEFIETSQGIRLLTNSIGNLMEALSSDNSALYAQAFTEISQNIQTYYPHLENVYDIIEETGELQEEIYEARKENDEERVKSLEQQKRLLETAARYQSNTAGSAGFNFMSSNLPGNAENYLTYIENIGSAQEALQGLASSGTIDAASLMRMFQFAEAENGSLPGDTNWTDIYEAISTASPDGTISAESLYGLFGVSSQADLAQAIADAMREADISFREKQAKIQDEITQEKQWLSSAGGIEENWEKIIGGEAPLTVRMDGEPIKEMTEPMAKELAAKWATLSEGEQKQILDTGVWEISTIDQTVQKAADTLTSIDEKINQIITGAVGTNLREKADRLSRDAEAYEAASFKYTLNPTKAAEEAMIAAQQAYNQSLDEFNVAKAEFDAIVGNVVTPNIQINKEKLYSDIVSATKKPVTLNIIPKFFAVPGLWTGNVNGLALAEGNATSKLIAGASMANKTLVGELGPELAVYNGQYHLLGQNGAEFVNLPSDAIVFNHKQTEGIAKGQMGVRGKAMSDGNLAELWKLYANNRNASGGWDITSGSGGGGKSYDFAEQEGEEWYNYLRRIAKLEQEINQLEAERENIMDGGAYLRNLRETQTIYQEQLITQKQLLEYQKAQLELERKQIEEKWGNVLTFTDEGLLQYAVGNETNGGKGVLNILELFNSMSGKEQVAKVKELGYSYTDQNGKALEGEELVQKFLEELTGDYEHYNDLYDSVAESTAELEEFKKAIKEAEDEIRDNRIELEEKIYDLVVEGWENNIEKMEEELDILSEANERYINGLSEALEKEKSLYDKNEATADREQLQRRLSLLRRSGGSASEIASLEEQLNDTLKDEYFQHQQEAIDKVAEASQTQIEKMEEQIQIQKDQLEFSKEHGLIWEDVNRILSGSTSEILEFIQGNDSTFIEKSATEIGKQLEEWSKKVGIFTEDRQTQEYTKEATKNFNADTLNSSVFNKASAEEKKTYTDLFASYFTNARMEGQDADAAYDYAYAELRKTLGEGGEGSDTGGGTGGTGNSGGGDTGGTSGRVKYDFQGKTYTASSKEEAWTAINLKAKALEEQLIESALRNVVHGGDAEELKKAAQGTATNIRQKAKSSIRPYSKGGLVDYTGLAMVHGSKSRPESFLNAEQTAQITEALHSNGKNSVLSDVRQAVTEIAAAAKALVMNETNNSSSINVAPGAVVVKVEKLNDKYDIDSVADDIMNKMVSIASKATSRGVNRR